MHNERLNNVARVLNTDTVYRFPLTSLLFAWMLYRMLLHWMNVRAKKGRNEVKKNRLQLEGNVSRSIVSFYMTNYNFKFDLILLINWIYYWSRSSTVEQILFNIALHEMEQKVDSNVKRIYSAVEMVKMSRYNKEN